MGQFITILLLALGISVVLESVHCARRVDASKRAKEVMRKRREEAFERRRSLHYRDSTHVDFNRAVDETDVSVDELLHLTPGETMNVVYEGKSSLGSKIEKLQESYLGVDVLDALVTVKTDKTGKLTGDASGEFIQGIDEDLKNVQPRLTDEESLAIALKSEKDQDKRNLIGNIKVERNIILDTNDKARLVNKVQYLIEADKKPKRPTYIIDANTGEVLVKFNNIDTLCTTESFDCGLKRNYRGYGGNEKMGFFKYGKAPYCLDMRIEDGVCYLDNKYAEVVDMHNTRDDSVTEVASFNCTDGYNDAVNGALSPALDAFFYATIVGKMYEDWYATSAWPHKIIIRVHFGTGYENAFWNGQNCTFGDGASVFYPFSNSLDVVSHEVGHGVTEHGSGLFYFDEAGGMNEAFSDIIGEAAHEYLGVSDLETGAEIMKRLDNLREFETPENDGRSIGHVEDMHPDVDPHYSSGVYRRVFYVLVKEQGMSVKNAAHVFLHANRLYWHHAGTFYDCACGLMKAAIDLGYNTTAFEAAVQDVGISPCNYTDHIYRLANNITQAGVTVSSEIRPIFAFETPNWAQDVVINATNNVISIHIRVQNTLSAQDADLLAEGDNYLVVNDMASRTLYIQFSTNSTTLYDDAAITVGYTCVSEYSTYSDDYRFYRWDCGF